MEEMLDTFDINGKFVGVKSRSFCHSEKPGVYHKPVWIWIVNSKGEILVQKRALTKKKSPGKWDMPSAGHISAGESCLLGCIRETKEELGIEVKKEDFIFLKEFLVQRGWELAQIFKKLIYSDKFCNHDKQYKDWVCEILKEYTLKEINIDKK